MNHIAHFLLAPQTVPGTVGTLLADFHRGAVSDTLPAPMDILGGSGIIDQKIDKRTAERGIQAGGGFR